MKITIKLKAGPNHKDAVTKADIQTNIDVLQRAIDGELLARDFVLLVDTQSILEAIRKQLPIA